MSGSARRTYPEPVDRVGAASRAALDPKTGSARRTYPKPVPLTRGRFMRDNLRLIISLIAGPLGLALLIGGSIAYYRTRRRISIPISGLILLFLFTFTLINRWRSFEQWFAQDVDNVDRIAQLS